MKHIDDPAAVGRRIREVREAQGISQRGLSFPGCSAAYISRIEAGDRTPSRQMLDEIARLLRTSRRFLETGVDVITLELSATDIDAQMVLWTSGQETPPLQLADLTDQERHQLEQTLHQAVAKAAGSLARAIQINRDVAARTEEARLEEETAAEERARTAAAAELDRAVEESVA